jgi:hypothetical protein
MAASICVVLNVNRFMTCLPFLVEIKSKSGRGSVVRSSIASRFFDDFFPNVALYFVNLPCDLVLCAWLHLDFSSEMI